MFKRWKTLYLCLFVILSTVSLCMTAQSIMINNYHSAFRVEGADLDFNLDLSSWDGGVLIDPPIPFLSFNHPDTYTIPQGVVIDEYENGTGLGTITVDITRGATAAGTASGSFHAFFDLEVDETINTFFNEFGEADTFGTGINPNAFEIDEPGFLSGNIDWNFVDGNLDNFNNIPSDTPDDVAVALGWENFQLLDGQSGLLTLVVSDLGMTVADLGLIDPTDVFTLRHLDPDSGATITFSGALEITGSPPSPDVIPEPATFILLGFGILGLAGIRLKRFLKP
ncbi:PEP-CTERM sorting domain-containing protein [bacterium]|nr:PEP-CTERM sorting domain-containing protein [bacterium]